MQQEPQLETWVGHGDRYAMFDGHRTSRIELVGTAGVEHDPDLVVSASPAAALRLLAGLLRGDRTSNDLGGRALNSLYLDVDCGSISAVPVPYVCFGCVSGGEDEKLPSSGPFRDRSPWRRHY